MKLGMIINQGTEKEVRKEFNNLLEKARKGYQGLVSVTDDSSFKIKTEGLEIIFEVDEYFKEYAIYQIFN